jgi:uncharacterized protein (TIGR02680 family)
MDPQSWMIKEGKTMERWKLSRAGILNFWFYDDEELVLEDGRLILRGSNGSGKSVTMQSLIPLVLDGDKRPERLDPFGSRDRKMEYYLLGDTEQGHTDRTGYLWLEFFHSGKELYKTIGIGLRARKGASQLGFWGFLLDDGRRINKDFYLYDYTLWLENKKKKPLNKKLLEEKISAGGQVVQEQAAYRDLVNKSLFGFRESESYKDLLKLMLEIRSPKLSKEFKPSSIYDILTKALPPLMEDELTGLSDVLEDMDQITDRLEELELHINELKKLEQIYDMYNKYQLQQCSKAVLSKGEKHKEISQRVQELEKKLVEIITEKQSLSAELEENIKKQERIETELEVLNRSEAMEKQRELEVSENDSKKLKEQINRIMSRLEANQNKVVWLQQEVQHTEKLVNDLVSEKLDLLMDLESLSRMIEFKEHDIYHSQWERGIPENERWASSWMDDLKNHQSKLENAEKIAQAEKKASIDMAEEKEKWGDAYKHRGLSEEEYGKAQEQIEIGKEEMKSEIICWNQKLKQMVFDKDKLREILQTLSAITTDNRDYSSVTKIINQVYLEQNEEMIKINLRYMQQVNDIRNNCKLLDDELEEWRTAKEPEPNRTRERESVRNCRDEKQGAPLYSVCDFSKALTEEERAQLETTLEQIGILDAWILPGGKVRILYKEEGEEVWIEASPKRQGETLAKVLIATPSLESGLTEEDVMNALNSIEWKAEDDYSSIEQESIPFIGKNQFKLGILAGKNVSKQRAEYIGQETRTLTKNLTIKELENKINILKQRIEEINQDIALNNIKQSNLLQDKNYFPSDKSLQKQIDESLKLYFRLNEIIRQEQECERRYKDKESIWHDIKLKLIEETADWIRLKSSELISEAVKYSRDYLHLLVQLKSLWMRYNESTRYYNNQKDELTIVEENIVLEQEEKSNAENDLFIADSKVKQLVEIISTMGLADIYKKIKNLKEEKFNLTVQVKVLYEKKEECSRSEGSTNTKLLVSKEELHVMQSDLNMAFKCWKEEISLALIQNWKDKINNLNDNKDIYKYCKEILLEIDITYSGNKGEQLSNGIYDEYNRVRSTLQDYVLEVEILNSGRIIILSKRDRFNPLTPFRLLSEITELLEEQNSLLTVRDKQLYQEIIIGSVGKAIRDKIHRANDWVYSMDKLMKQRNTSSGLKLSLHWIPLAQKSEDELDSRTLVDLLLSDPERMEEEEIDKITLHFRKRIDLAKEEAKQEQGTLRRYINQMLDYRSWFEFRLDYRKGERSNYIELTDSRFNVLSGGEKAMAMYIPLFAAASSRYSDAAEDAPKIISLDEAFAGVDDSNMRDMFELLTDMNFDYIMTSQVLWGCYDTVPSLAIYEIHRTIDTNMITLLHYRWNGKRKILLEN